MLVRLARRNIGRNARRSIFAGALAALGAIIAMVAVGFMSATFFVVKEQAIRAGIGHFQVARAGEFDGYEDAPMQHGLAPSEVARIEAGLPPGATALPRIGFEGVASIGERSLVFIAQAVDPDAERMLGDWTSKLVAGENLSGAPEASETVLLGVELARLLGVKVGQSITLMTPTVAGGLNAADVKVVGIVSQGMRDADRVLVIAPLALAQSLLGTDRVDRVSVLLDDERSAPEVQRRVERAAGGTVTSRSWRSLAPLYDQLVALYTRQFSVFGIVIGLMIALAVANTIAMAVLERRRESATMLALGIPRNFIRWMFLLEGAGIAFLGGCLGVVLGWLTIRIVNVASIRMPPAPGATEGYQLYLLTEPWAGAATVGLLTVLGTAAGWIASGSIHNDRIMEDLRHE